MPKTHTRTKVNRVNIDKNVLVFKYLCTNLIAALASLKMNNFPHVCLFSNGFNRELAASNPSPLLC